MKILHLTDLHFNQGKYVNHEKGQIYTKLLSGQNFDSCDLIVFTGDLSNNGGKSEDFENAFNFLKQFSIIDNAIKNSKFFICCGNHDVDRSQISLAIKNRIRQSIVTSEDIFQFVKSSDRDFLASLEPTNKFFKVAKNNISYQNFSDNNLISSNIVEVNNNKVLIVSYFQVPNAT